MSSSAFKGPFTTREYEVKLVIKILPFLPSFVQEQTSPNLGPALEPSSVEKYTEVHLMVRSRIGEIPRRERRLTQI